MRSVAGRRIGIWVVRTDEEAVLFPWVVLPYCDDFLAPTDNRAHILVG